MSPIPKWPEKIKAPKDAMKLYRLMAKLQESKDFQKCHIFEGASVNGVPFVSWENKATALPRVVCSFMGLPYKKKTCNTPHCMNPFHFVDQNMVAENRLPVEQVHQPAQVVTPSLEDFIETVRYYIEENDLTNPTFEQLRPIIHADDISDEILQKAIYEISSKL